MGGGSRGGSGNWGGKSTKVRTHNAVTKTAANPTLHNRLMPVTKILLSFTLTLLTSSVVALSCAAKDNRSSCTGPFPLRRCAWRLHCDCLCDYNCNCDCDCLQSEIDPCPRRRSIIERRSSQVDTDFQSPFTERVLCLHPPANTFFTSTIINLFSLSLFKSSFTRELSSFFVLTFYLYFILFYPVKKRATDLQFLILIFLNYVFNWLSDQRVNSKDNVSLKIGPNC